VVADPYRDSIYIEAEPAVVFDYFTQAEALAKWMGDRALLDPRPGGHFIVFFEERAVEGRYVELDRPKRLVISWGRVGSRALAPESSTLEVTLRTEGTGTRVDIVHSGLPESEAPRHALGWRHYLSRLASVAAGRQVEPHRTPEQLTRGVD
jgi:uncharacterized protein YndB with AHSA1/START domain